MRTRLILIAVPLLGLGAAGPALAAHSSAPPVPPACVVVNANGDTLQVGYAPDGPSDCTSLP